MLTIIETPHQTRERIRRAYADALSRYLRLLTGPTPGRIRSPGELREAREDLHSARRAYRESEDAAAARQRATEAGHYAIALTGGR